MENFSTIYNEREKINSTKNAWEYYFKNFEKYKLREVYKSHKVIFTDNKFRSNFIYDLEKDKILLSLFKKKIKIQPRILREFKKISKKFKNNKILGIHFRGTSYKRSAGHPFPATKKQMGKIVDYIFKKENF